MRKQEAYIALRQRECDTYYKKDSGGNYKPKMDDSEIVVKDIKENTKLLTKIVSLERKEVDKRSMGASSVEAKSSSRARKKYFAFDKPQKSKKSMKINLTKYNSANMSHRSISSKISGKNASKRLNHKMDELRNTISVNQASHPQQLSEYGTRNKRVSKCASDIDFKNQKVHFDIDYQQQTSKEADSEEIMDNIQSKEIAIDSLEELDQNTRCIKEFNTQDQRQSNLKIDVAENSLSQNISNLEPRDIKVIKPVQDIKDSSNKELKERISQLEQQLIKTQADLLNKNSEFDKLKEEVSSVREERDSLVEEYQREITNLEQRYKDEHIKFNLCYDSNEKLNEDVDKYKEELIIIKEELYQKIARIQSDLNQSQSLCENLREENQILQIKVANKNDFKREPRPSAMSSFDSKDYESPNKKKTVKLQNSLSKTKEKKRKTFSVISEVKQWVSSEISSICLNSNEDRNLHNQMLFNVDVNNPLYPLMEMMNCYTKDINKKQQRIDKLEDEISSLKLEVFNHESKLTPYAKEKLTELKNDIKKEIELIINQVEPEKQVHKIIDVLSAFGIEIKLNKRKDLRKEIEEDNVVLQEDDDSRSNKSVSPSRFLGVPNIRTDLLKSLKFCSNLNNDSELQYSARTSMNPYEATQENYLKDASLNIEKLLESSRFGNEENSTHQVCNIKIRELIKYCNHLEGENLSLTTRLQHQITINENAEKENNLVTSQLSNKENECEILKTCLKQNTEITKELQKILGSTSNTLDITKTDNRSLNKKIKKYKKLLKNKDKELNSISNYAIGESMANDIGLIFQNGENSRPVSSSSHLQRFNPNIASQGKASNQNQQTNFINYLSNSRDPSIYSTPNGKKMDPKDAGSVEVINNFISPDPKKIVFTNEKIIQESSLENVREYLISRRTE